MNGLERFRGALVGLAVGDALGAPIEMCLPGTFEPITDMRGGGYFKLAPGEWTDDTALALCSAESLLVKGDFDPRDHLSRFLKWYREGYLGTRAEAIGIGLVMAGALMRFESTGEDFCGPTGPKTAHNGSLMCLAPIVLSYAYEYEAALHYAEDFSRLTHGAPVALDACRYLAHCIVRTLEGRSKREALSGYAARTSGLQELAAGGYTRPPRITEANYADATTTLHAALWAFHDTDSFEEGALRAVNLGWDADTAGAVYGQLAGAFYGIEAIPRKWHGETMEHEKIAEYAEALYRLQEKKRPPLGGLDC